jgi:4-hydroxy-tetrahydrodipicolinate reductase
MGALGKMGKQSCQAVTDAPDLELVASLDQGDDVAQAAAAGAQVLVEFTNPDSAEEHVHAALDNGLHAVVGTTGWSAESLARVTEHLAKVNADREANNQLGVLIAPNFATSAVLAMKFAAIAAPLFESVEVVELHHPAKLDAPSGTAKATATAIAAARAAAGVPEPPDATESGFEARGMKVAGIPVHAVRLRGLVAHEEILLGNPGEQLTIRTDSFDRISFMPGVLLAVREVAKHPGLTVGLENYLPN